MWGEAQIRNRTQRMLYERVADSLRQMAAVVPRAFRPTDLRKELNLLKGGKRVYGSTYLHIGTIGAQNAKLLGWLSRVAQRAGANPNFDIVRLRPERLQVSFLYYPNFRSDAHPTLLHSTFVDYGKWIVEARTILDQTGRFFTARRPSWRALIPTSNGSVR